MTPAVAAPIAGASTTPRAERCGSTKCSTMPATAPAISASRISTSGHEPHSARLLAAELDVGQGGRGDDVLVALDVREGEVRRSGIERARDGGLQAVCRFGSVEAQLATGV